MLQCPCAFLHAHEQSGASCARLPLSKCKTACAALAAATPMLCTATRALHAATNSLRIPKVLAWGDTSDGSYLIIEHLNFGGRADQAEMGRQLALMHKAEPKVRQAQPCLRPHIAQMHARVAVHSYAVNIALPAGACNS